MKKAQQKIQDLYPLSPSQEGILFHSLMDQAGGAYFEQSCYRVEGQIRVEAMRKAIDLLAGRHEVLRTAFVPDKADRPLQVVLRSRSLPFEVVDLRGEADPQQAALAFQEADRKRGFNLTKEPLMRLTVLQVADALFEFVWSYHHIILDGWCSGILFKEFFALYYAVLEGREPVLTPVRPYKEYILWLEKQDRAAAKAFWEEYLKGYEAAAGLPQKHPVPLAEYEGTQHRFLFSRALSSDLEQLAASRNLTLSTVLQCLWGVLLARYCDTDDVVFGGVMSGRPPKLPGVESMIGLFVNTLPVRIRLEAGATFSELAAEVQRADLKRSAFSFYPLAEVLSEHPLRNQLFDHAMSLQNYPDKEEIAGFSDASGAVPELVLKGQKSSKRSNFDFQMLMVVLGQVVVEFEYNSVNFDPAMVSRLEGHFRFLAEQVVVNPDVVLSDLQLCNAAERKLVLETFNPTAVPYQFEVTLQALFEARAAHMEDRVAIRHGDQRMTFGALNRLANQLADYLHTVQGVSRGDKVGILMQPSGRRIAALIAVLKLGAAFVPLSEDFPEARKQFMIEDAGIKMIVEDTWPDDLVAYSAENPPAVGSPDDLVYLIYTSGSTGKPKGVPIRQRGPINVCHSLISRVGYTEADVHLHHVNFIFDMSIHEFVIPIFFTGSVVICEKEDARDPERLKAVIERYGVSSGVFVTGVYAALLSTLEGGEDDRLNSLRVVCLGGEKVTRELLDLHYQYFDWFPINGYGPTESTMLVTYHACQPGESTIPIGPALDNSQLSIRDRELRLQPVGVPGEICVAGAGLSPGYVNRPEVTAATFIANPDPSPGYEVLYRTGDLGYWQADGEMVFLNRRDQQWKIRGYRVETGEIEVVMAAFPGIRKAVVVPVLEGQHARLLVGWYEADTPVEEAELVAFLALDLPEYMIPSRFNHLEALPYMPSGKLDRKQLQENALQVGHVDQVPPATDTERQLALIWSQLLGTEEIGRGDDFFKLGGHSLKAIRLTTLIARDMGRKVEVFDVFDHSSLEALGALLDTQEKVGVEGISRLPAAAHYPLAPTQMRLWILDQLQSDVVSYNLQLVFVLDGKLDRKAMNRAFLQLIDRFEILRTVFIQVDEEPRQRVLPVDPAVHGLDFSDFSTDSDPEAAVVAMMAARLQERFDLENGPLFKAELVLAGEDRHFCCFTLHHLISDWWSLDILMRDFVMLYLAETTRSDLNPAPLAIQYRDFAAWQAAQLQGAALEKLEAYWRRVFETLPPLVALPADLGRPAQLTNRGAVVEFSLDPDVVTGLKVLGEATDASLFMVLLATVKLLLYRYTGETDLVTASPMTGRPHPQLEEQVGFFVDTVLIRSQLDPDTSFRDLLMAVRSNTLGAYAHQALPFHKLVELVDPVRNTNHAPLTDISVELLQESGKAVPEFPGLKVHIPEQQTSISNVDLGFLFHSSGEAVKGLLQFRTDLYSVSRVEAFRDQLLSLMRGVVAAPDAPLHTCFKLPVAHYQWLMAQGSGPEDLVPYRPLPAYIREHAATRGEAVALVRGNETVSYAELDRQSDSIAAWLQERVSPGAFVPILIPRSTALPVAILGILKAGCAYVPLDVDWPAQRVAAILETVQAAVVIGTAPAEGLPESYRERYWQFDLASLPERSCRPHLRQAEDPIYGIFTSGSTGQPKCAVNLDQALHNRLWQMVSWFEIGEGDRILLANQPVFDTAFWQMFLPLLRGGCCVIPEREGLSDLAEWVALFRRERISMTAFVPSVFRLFVQLLEELDLKETDFPAWRHLMQGGEALNPDDLRRFRKRFPGVPITNSYGPTETAIGTLFHLLPDEIPAVIPIGRPIANTKAYLLDAYQNLVPPGAVGELYLGGICVGAGYLHDPDRTSRAFFPDPFEAPGTGAMLYKTGDLARLDPDGRVLFLGRKDQQVKLNGIRVELEEIEAVLLAFDGLREAVVRVVETAVYKGLVGWYSVGKPVEEDALRRFLQDRLPAYMVPGKLILMDTFPRLSTGKLDRRGLPLPDSGAELLSGEQPDEGFESRLAGIWSAVLGIAHPGVSLNFFEAGGDSLKLIHLGTAINRAFGCKLDPIALVGHPTIRSQAVRIKAALGEAVFEQAGSELSSMVLRPFGLPGPARPALYFFPPFAGYGIVYLDLARRFGQALAPVLFSYQGFGPDEALHTSLEAMYASYVTLISDAHPVEEPVLLLGYSSGGKLAFEVGKRLEALGYRCRYFLLEAEPNSAVMPVSEPDMQLEMDELEKEIRAYLGRQEDHGEIVARTRLVVGNFAKLWAAYLTEGRVRGDLFLLGGPAFKEAAYAAWAGHTEGVFEAQLSLEGSHRKLLEHEGNLVQIVHTVLMKSGLGAEHEDNTVSDSLLTH